MSQGVDQGLLWHFCRQLNPEEQFFRRKNAQLFSLRYFSTLCLVWLGGPVGAKSFRLAIALSSVSYLLGGFASLFIHDDSTKLVSRQNIMRDIWRIARESFQLRPLRLRLVCYAVGREMTHAIIWIYTPLLLQAGVPLSIVSSAWALNSIACLVGTKLAGKYSLKLQDWQIFTVPVVLLAASMGVMSWRVNLWTIWTYLFMGIIQGWSGATLAPLVQRYARPEEQTSVVSLASTIGRIIYIPTLFIVGWVADFRLTLVPPAVFVMFVPLGIGLIVLLSRE